MSHKTSKSKGSLIVTNEQLPLTLKYGDREYRLCGTSREKLVLQGERVEDDGENFIDRGEIEQDDSPLDSTP